MKYILQNNKKHSTKRFLLILSRTHTVIIFFQNLNIIRNNSYVYENNAILYLFIHQTYSLLMHSSEFF